MAEASGGKGIYCDKFPRMRHVNVEDSEFERRERLRTDVKLNRERKNRRTHQLNGRQKNFFRKCQYKGPVLERVEESLEDSENSQAEEDTQITENGVIDELKKTINEQAITIQKLKEEVQQLKLKKYPKDESNEKKRKRCNNGEDSVSDTVAGEAGNSTKDAQISTQEVMLVKKDAEIQNLREMMQHGKSGTRKITTSPTREKARVSESAENEIIQEIKRSLEKQLVEMKESIKKSIDEKIEAVKRPIQTYASTLSQNLEANTSDESNAIQHQMNFRQIKTNTRNEELAEERKKKQRDRNIIVHGREDDNDTDTIFVKDLFAKLQIEQASVKSIQRIGMATNGPIKMEMHTIQDKIQVLRSLTKLKGDNNFKGIRITEDYTISERKLIKEYNSRAKEKTDTDPDKDQIIWRVRGSPRKGLFLKRFVKLQGTVQGC